MNKEDSMNKIISNGIWPIYRRAHADTFNLRHEAEGLDAHRELMNQLTGFLTPTRLNWP